MKPKKYKRKKKIIRKIIAAVAVVAFFGWFISLRINTEPSKVGYDMVLAYEKHDISTYLNTSGVIVLKDAQNISVDVSQKVKKLYFKVGDKVSQGDVLCEFENEHLDEQITLYSKIVNDIKELERLNNGNDASDEEYSRKDADLSVEITRMALEAAKEEYDIANAKYDEYYMTYYNSTDDAEIEMYYSLYKEYEGSLEKLSQSVDEAQKKYDMAVETRQKILDNIDDRNFLEQFNESQTYEYEKKLNDLKSEREKLIVTAPRSGIVTKCYAQEGAYLMNGELYTIGTLGDYEVDAVISDRDIFKVKKGDEVFFTTQLTGEKKISGVVESVSEYYGVSGYSAKIKITDDEALKQLKPNINASVHMYTFKSDPVYSVAYDSVKEDENGRKYVFKAVENNGQYIAQRVDVEVGYDENYYVEIVSSQLKEGDLVVCNAEKIKEGDKIKLKGKAE